MKILGKPNLLIIWLLLCLTNTLYAQTSRPNIVLIYADDLGYNDLSCYGSQINKSPNIDQLAAKGMRYTDFYAPAPICSPSRAGLLTGKYPISMGIQNVFFPESWNGMPPQEITIPEVLNQAGYTSKLVGKWHLGHRHEYLPIQQGFDEYFGIPYSNDMAGLVYINNNEMINQPVDQSLMTARFTSESISFIERSAKVGKPFFLMLAHAMPHVPLYASASFAGKSKAGLYADVVAEMDWSTGRIMRLLDSLNIAENTIVIFTSDNGPWLAFGPDGGSAKPLRSGKQYTFDGGMRVPMLIRWTGKVKPGQVNKSVSSQLDFLPTLAALAGIEFQHSVHGTNIAQQWLRNSQETERDMAYYSHGKLEAYRSGKWKIKLPFEGADQKWWREPVAPHDTLLIDLENDPGEVKNLAKNQPGKVKGLLAKMNAHKTALGDLPPLLNTRIPADESHLKRQKVQMKLE